MASNSFGKHFRITTWGESHGHSIGVVIDGCPAGIEIHLEKINAALKARAPGQSPYTSPRKETDQAEILSGIFEGKTTGAPIAIMIQNMNQDSSKYTPIKNILRPGHANQTYIGKYGIFDYRGGGRSSARETAARVAAGAVAKELLKKEHIHVLAYIKQIANIKAKIKEHSIIKLQELRDKSPLFCPDLEKSQEMGQLIKKVKEEGDSLGGIIEFQASNLPIGLGDPIYDKLESLLACAMMSIPATKGFEIGSGFSCIHQRGSEHNDSFYTNEEGKVITETNNSGGILGGISNGMPLIGRVAFKATSSIFKAQKSVDLEGKIANFELPKGSRHDPCVVPRAVPIVEAMLSLTLADALLSNRLAK